MAAMCRQKGGTETGPSPVDRGRLGSKHHLIVDAQGIPLAWTLSGGNRHDSTQLEPLLDRIPRVGGRPGAARRRPRQLLADRAYDYTRCRRELRKRGITALIARRQSEHGSGLGRNRWVVDAPLPGSTATAAWPSATTATPTCTKPSSPSPAA